MAKIVVTGATGFVGRHLVSALVQAGHQVRCAVLRKVDWLAGEQIIVNKLEHQEDWRPVLVGMDCVIHLAAKVHQMPNKDLGFQQDYHQINALATQKLIEQAASQRIKRFIFLSSIKVNGENTYTNKSFSEDDFPQPLDAYAHSKLAAERCLQEVCQTTAMEYVILRPPLVYGPGVKANFLKIMHLVAKGWPLPFAKVSNKRNFIFIDNLVSALCSVVVDPKAANQLFLVADATAISLANLSHQLAQSMSRPSRLLPVPVGLLTGTLKLLGKNDLNGRLFGSLQVNTDKIHSCLGWVAPVPTEEGLQRTGRWFSNEFLS